LPVKLQPNNTGKEEKWQNFSNFAAVILTGDFYPVGSFDTPLN